MLKVIFGVAVVAIATAFGYLFSKKYRQRRRFFTQFREFNEQFIHEITYYRRPIKEFLSCHTYDREFDMVLQKYEAILSNNAFKNRELFDLSEYSFLNENEKTDITDYFMTIGTGDSASQKCYFLSMRERLSKYESDAISQGKKYENLYIELGFLCGLFILILII